MSNEARKLWTRNYCLARLEAIENILSQLTLIADDGKMPKSLRNRLQATNGRVRATCQVLRQWAITGAEKAQRKEIR